jgi:tripartite-type tricarboxylate transporter receptor subunit TctC
MKHFSGIACLATGLALLCGASGAPAQEYPSKLTRLVVPFAVGGAPDVVARNIASRLGDRLGQGVIIDNRLGAAGNIAYEMVARSAPDGYTLLFASTGIATNVSLYKHLSYGTMKDFAPIMLVAKSPHVLVTNLALPAKTVQELIALGKSQAGRLSFGSSGNETIPHLAGEMFMAKTGTELLHVAYKGMSLAQPDLIGGSIHLMFSDIPSVLPQLNAGRLRALAVTGEQRSQAMPNVPTIAEAGVPGYAIEAWFGILAPVGTPVPIINRLNRELRSILIEPELKRRMLEMGQELIGNSPREFSTFLHAEIKKMGDIVKASGATVN